MGNYALNGDRFAMERRGSRVGLIQEVLGSFHLVGRPVDDQEELAVLDLGLVLQDAVLRDADAVQSGAERAEPPDHGRALRAPRRST